MKYYDKTTKGFYEETSEDRIEITDSYWRELLDKQSQGGTIQVIEGKLICTMPTDIELETAKKTAKKNELQSQINSIDIKRIRAIAEGGNYTEEKTWLEYYTEQIVALRAEIASL